jgi:hypothetical protein
VRVRVPSGGPHHFTQRVNRKVWCQLFAYIDDSGDEGTQGRGSRWLVFGCAMVSDNELAATRQVAQAACAALGGRRPRWIHFKDMSHDDKHGVIEILKKGAWEGVIVASDTTQAQSMLTKSRYQYNYATG